MDVRMGDGLGACAPSQFLVRLPLGCTCIVDWYYLQVFVAGNACTADSHGAWEMQRYGRIELPSISSSILLLGFVCSIAHLALFVGAPGESMTRYEQGDGEA